LYRLKTAVGFGLKLGEILSNISYITEDFTQFEAETNLMPGNGEIGLGYPRTSVLDEKVGNRYMRLLVALTKLDIVSYQHQIISVTEYPRLKIIFACTLEVIGIERTD
jgi:hypothetical protein